MVDNFERGLGAVTAEEKENAFVQGMEKVYKQLMTTLEGIEVKPIEAVGKEFDPNFHNAVMHVEDENLGENIVAEELQKGYMYRDSVVRPVSYTHLAWVPAINCIRNCLRSRISAVHPFARSAR